MYLLQRLLEFYFSTDATRGRLLSWLISGSVLTPDYILRGMIKKYFFLPSAWPSTTYYRDNCPGIVRLSFQINDWSCLAGQIARIWRDPRTMLSGSKKSLGLALSSQRSISAIATWLSWQAPHNSRHMWRLRRSQRSISDLNGRFIEICMSRGTRSSDPTVVSLLSRVSRDNPLRFDCRFVMSTSVPPVHSNSVFNGLVVFSIHYFRPSCMFYFLGN